MHHATPNFGPMFVLTPLYRQGVLRGFVKAARDLTEVFHVNLVAVFG